MEKLQVEAYKFKLCTLDLFGSTFPILYMEIFQI